MPRSPWFKALVAILLITIAGCMVTYFAWWGPTAAQANHLTWCNQIEGGSATWMYGHQCPTYYVTYDMTANKQAQIAGCELVFALIVIIGVIVFGTIVTMVWNSLRGDYSNPVKGVQQRHYDQRFALIMEHGGFTDEQVTRLTVDPFAEE